MSWGLLACHCLSPTDYDFPRCLPPNVKPWAEAGAWRRGRIKALLFICHPESSSVSVMGQACYRTHSRIHLGRGWKPAWLALGMRGEETNTVGLACIPLAASPTDPCCKTSQGDLIFPACICLKAATAWLLLYKAAAVKLRMRLAPLVLNISENMNCAEVQDKPKRAHMCCTPFWFSICSYLLWFNSESFLEAFISMETFE